MIKQQELAVFHSGQCIKRYTAKDNADGNDHY